MEKDHLDDYTDRDILVETRIVVARLEERTTDLPGVYGRLSKVEGDVGWIKKIGAVFGSVAVTVAVGTVTILLKIRGLI